MADEKSLVGFDVCGPLAIRSFVVEKKCQSGETHTHNYPHVTVVNSGGVVIEWETLHKDGEVEHSGVTGEIWATDIINYIHVPANARHKIKVLDDNTRYSCFFSHRDADGIVVQDYNERKESYA